MPRKTRQPVRLLPHKKASGLFLTADGEYIADIKPNDGKRTIRRLGHDKVRAHALFDDLLAELQERQDDKQDPRVVDFLTGQFLPSQQRLKSYRTSADAVRAVVRFLDNTEPNLRVRDVRRHHVERLRTHYAELSPRTQNAYTHKLSQGLNYAVDLGLLDTNPVARVKPLTVDNRRTDYLTMDDFVRILDAAANTDAVDLFRVVGLTGLRPSNVRLLTVDEVNIEQQALRIPPEKMKNRRWGIVPISPLVVGLLSQRMEGNETDAPLFPARGGDGSSKGRCNLSRSYRSLIRRLDGLEWSTLYDLRHFFASQLARQGANELQIGRLLCHVGQAVTGRYVHQDIEDLRHFVDELADRYLEASGAPSLSQHAEQQDEERITV